MYAEIKISLNDSFQVKFYWGWSLGPYLASTEIVVWAPSSYFYIDYLLKASLLVEVNTRLFVQTVSHQFLQRIKFSNCLLIGGSWDERCFGNGYPYLQEAILVPPC